MKMAGVSRFDCYPSDFLNGIVGLTTDQIAAYTVVVMLIYDRGEPIPYVGREREVQVRSGLTRKRLDAAISNLLELGKLSVADGTLSNSRAATELEKFREKSEKNRENSEKGGNSTREKWIQKHNEINGYAGPNGQPSPGPARARPSPSPSPLDSSLRSESSSLRSESSVSEKPIRARKRKTPSLRIDYPPDFERFWRGYPTDSNMSKAEALPEWEKLDASDREAAERSLIGFRAYCSKNPDYRPLHANRYLKRRRFDGHLAMNGHDESAPRSEKEVMMNWAMEHNGFSLEQAEARWEFILQHRRSQNGENNG